MSDTAVAESGTRLQNFLDRAGLRGFPWKTATILYTISWGWLFIVRDSYWSDDWTSYSTYANPEPGLVEQGVSPLYKYLVLIVKFQGPTFARVIIFLAFLAAGLFLFGILRRSELFDQRSSRMAVLAFLLLPFNTARVTLMVLFSSLCYFTFFLAWYLMISSTKKKTFALSQMTFFISFGFHSLLLFYLIPVLHKYLLSKTRSIKSSMFFIQVNFLVVVLPIFYWVARTLFWPEKVQYHDVNLAALSTTVNFVAISGTLLFVTLFLQRKAVATKNSIQFLFGGIFCLFCGIYPYVIYGFFLPDWSFFSTYFVTFLGRSDWYSRHQFLQPLGAALLIVGVIGLLPNFLKKFTKLVQALILAVCVLLNIGFGFEHVVDHAKQKEILTVLKEEGEGKLGRKYQFVDQTTLLNARGRAYRERDWKGLIWMAYGVKSMQASRIETMCESPKDARLVLIQGPETHWEALKNWVSDGEMGFKVTVDDTLGACKPEMVTSEKVSGTIPILFYFTGAKG